MSSEKEKGQQEHKIHRTHFSIEAKPPLKDTGQESKYEWVPSGTGKFIRVPKKSEEEMASEFPSFL